MNLPATMRAMVVSGHGGPLKEVTVPVPKPGTGQVLIKVAACGVCRTDLHTIDGELNGAMLPLILGHEILGTVVGLGEGVTHLKIAATVGILWLAHTCGKCKYCLTGRENLRDQALFTALQSTADIASTLWLLKNTVCRFPVIINIRRQRPCYVRD